MMRNVPETPWGARIKTRREELGLSREYLAGAVGPVTLSTVYRWEQSRNAPNRETMQKIADVLQTEPCALFFRNECEAA
jgi:transcriptional regulator with XRE-family HTH domain